MTELAAQSLRNAAKCVTTRLSSAFLLQAGMHSKLDQLGFHCISRHTQPAGRPGLIAMGSINRSDKQFPLCGFKEAFVRVCDLTATGSIEELVDKIPEGFRR